MSLRDIFSNSATGFFVGFFPSRDTSFLDIVPTIFYSICTVFSDWYNCIMKKTVGILGGVGPLATADLFRKMVLMTEAGADQEHLHIIVDNDTSVPDRTEAILRGGEDPTPYFIRTAKNLVRAGAELIAMPCCTGHRFLPAVEEAVDAPIINMLSATARVLAEAGVKSAGLLATDGMLSTGLFESALTEYGVETIKPDGEGQRAVTDIIYNAVKSSDWSHDTAPFLRMADGLMSRGAQVLILGCTELPVAFEMFHIQLPFADPTAILAAEAIREAGGRVAEGRVIQFELRR